MHRRASFVVSSLILLTWATGCLEAEPEDELGAIEIAIEGVEPFPAGAVVTIALYKGGDPSGNLLTQLSSTVGGAPIVVPALQLGRYFVQASVRGDTFVDGATTPSTALLATGGASVQVQRNSVIPVTVVLGSRQQPRGDIQVSTQLVRGPAILDSLWTSGGTFTCADLDIIAYVAVGAEPSQSLSVHAVGPSNQGGTARIEEFGNPAIDGTASWELGYFELDATDPAASDPRIFNITFSDLSVPGGFGSVIMLAFVEPTTGVGEAVQLDVGCALGFPVVSLGPSLQLDYFAAGTIGNDAANTVFRIVNLPGGAIELGCEFYLGSGNADFGDVFVRENGFLVSSPGASYQTTGDVVFAKQVIDPTLFGVVDYQVWYDTGADGVADVRSDVLCGLF